ncbi:MAG: uL15m family ribosomal protein [Candidatus Micrarchaeaceae archaeon]
MVQRLKKRSRKYLGKRSWGAGNIKNNRGSGERGGVGKAGRKHKFTRIIVYERERLRKKGFYSWNRYRLKEIDLSRISKLAEESSEPKPVIELKGYKVLSDGSLEKPAVIKASGFSKRASEKIKNAGGETVQL